jgi:hypothetical protein
LEPRVLNELSELLISVVEDPAQLHLDVITPWMKIKGKEIHDRRNKTISNADNTT